MNTTSLWIIRVALTVQFVGVLAVPSLVAAADSPRAMWMAEWLRPESSGVFSVPRSERTIGVLKVRDGKLSFVEQIGQVDWELDLASVKRIAAINGGPSTALRTSPSTALRAGRWISISSVTGEEFVVSIMEANLTHASPKKAIALIERAVQSTSANSR